MKKIILIRHAKSSWNSGVLQDIDRPLNQRGRRDAPFMAKKLKGIVPKIDGIVKSPSRRTSQTSKFFLDEFSLNGDVEISDPNLYHGTLYNILDAVQSLPSEWETALLFGHNPGMTYVAEYFGGKEIVNVPTCGMLIVQSKVKDWAYLNNENSKIKSFEYPKKYNT